MQSSIQCVHGTQATFGIGKPNRLQIKLCLSVQSSTFSSLCMKLWGRWPVIDAVAAESAGCLAVNGTQLSVCVPLQACDEFGNARQSGGDRFHVAVRGVAADAVSVADRGDGSYKVGRAVLNSCSGHGFCCYWKIGKLAWYPWESSHIQPKYIRLEADSFFNCNFDRGLT
jgi:hypothetical protein